MNGTELPGAVPAARRVLVAALVALLCGCAPPEPTRFEGSTMGTYYRVSAGCPDLEPTLARRLEQELGQVNDAMSNYLPESELSRLNRSELGAWQPVSTELHEVLATAMVLFDRSGGALDITVAPVLRLWGFGPGASTPAQAPDASAVAAALAETGMGALELRSLPPAARRIAPIELDLSAIAKGYGVDRLSARLEAEGCRDYLVDIGGELRAAGEHPRGGPWRVGVEVPKADQFGVVGQVLTLADAALATSGDYRNFIELPDTAAGRQRWSHTIDPRSGHPVEHDLASVTVAAPSAMLADAWATALNVLGPEPAIRLARSEGLSALLLVRSAKGFEARYTGDFQSLLLRTGP
ncbi:MAG: FAD:protein FMN transferase [Pseudomonadota bacterium]